MRTSLLALLGWTLAASVATAQQGADDCAQADVLSPGPGAVMFDTENCSDTGLPATSGAPTTCLTLSDDVWFRWTALDDGTHTFSTCGAANFDTEIAVWWNPEGPGSTVDCSGLMPLGCNDDSPGCVGFTSDLSVALSAGQEVFVQVGDANLFTGDHYGQGTLTITLDAPRPANDLCSAPQSLVGVGDFPYDTTAATTSGFSAPGGCGNMIANDVFFTWSAPMPGDYRVSTCQTGYDTRLSVYTGSDCNAACLASDDDTCGFQSVVDLLGLAGGETFLIQVGGFGTEIGPGVLTVEGILPTGQDCSDPIDLGGAPGTFAYDTTGANSSGFAPAGCEVVTRDMFFTWTAPMDATWAFNTCATPYPSTLAVHDGTDCGALCLASGENGCGDMGSVRAFIGAGQTVLLQLGGFGPHDGPGTLEIAEYVDPCDAHPDDAFEENDDCATAALLARGKTTGLFARDTDADWYLVTVPPLSTAYVQALFVHADGDLDLSLFDACGAAPREVGDSNTDNEQVVYDNATVAPVDVLVLVETGASAGGSGAQCNEYELVFSLEAGMPGQTYCPATPNSTGLIAQMTGAGSTSVTANDLVVIANPIPSNVFGVFINSGTQAQIPFGSKVRCVAKPFFRSLVTQAQGSVLSFPIDNMITPGIFQGSTRYFQAWFRDNSDSDGFGLSNGYAVTFTE